MTIKASGRAALVIAAGLWIFALGPSRAADDADNTATPVVKPSLHHLKKYARHEPSKRAEKSSDSKKTADAADRGDRPARQSSQLPPSVANANAQLTTDTPASKDAKAMSERANNIVQAAADNAAAPPVSDSPVVASDQLNDVDRALAAPPAQPEAAAPVDAQQAQPASPSAANPPAIVVASSNGNSTWDQTSLIGKIFIGFGALLTLASAARMFIA